MAARSPSCWCGSQRWRFNPGAAGYLNGWRCLCPASRILWKIPAWFSPWPTGCSNWPTIYWSGGGPKAMPSLGTWNASCLKSWSLAAASVLPAMESLAANF